MSIPVPLFTGETDNAGNKKNASITVGLTPPILGGRYVWSVDSTLVLPGASFVSTHGTVRVANDGTSALVTSTSAGNIVLELANNEYNGWKPGHLYRINDVILDANGHVQRVTAASKRARVRYTPLAGSIPQGGEQAYFAEFALTSVANAGTNGNAAYAGTITGGASNAFVGRTFLVSGFVAHKLNNGKFICTASSATALTLLNVNALSETIASIAKSIGVGGDPQGYGRILNQGDGDINGDWPAGALLQSGANTNEVKAVAGRLAINSGPATSAAPVVFEVVGFSSSGASGISSPNSKSFNPNAGVFIAEYSEIGVGGQKVYIDQAGNSHTGWEIAQGTEVQVTAAGIPPAFSTTGGTVIDKDLVWTDQGSSPVDSDIWDTITLAVTDPSPAIAGNSVLLPLE